MIGRQRNTGIPVVIKAIKLRTNARRTEMNHISEEAAMNICKESSCIVSLLDSFTQNGKVYIVTEYCEGGDLFEYFTTQLNIKQQLFSEERIRHIFV